ncbi:uncharacterized protein LOC141544763 isoform X2 [Sminthopsis crassicaudata]|uniref:uncharacterized protein LOC141544763 isoform X2 n=1 Tax=Sminthopsis crassicaudata TaxID=9301 RepID=UPI003D68AF00
MKKIFDFGKKGQSSSSRFNLPSFFGSQPVYRTQGYLIQSKDLGKIHKAALRGDVVKVQQLLLLGKNTVNELDKMKRTPLHLACANGYPDVVSLLIERKCELDLLDNDNKTPLMKAIECQREECATILLEHGADPNLRDSHSNTLLHYIASGGNKFMAEKLIEHKIDIDAKNKEDCTPLMLAISAKNTELADFLLKNGANVNAMDDSKRTALMIAVSVEALGLVTLLLQHNADHTLQDNDGWTAEQYAKLYGYPINIYHKQIEDQKEQIEKEKKEIEKPKEQIEKQKEQIEKQKPCTPQISCSEKTSDSAPSLDKKAEDGIVEDSISRFSDNTGSDKSWLSTNELDFDRKVEEEKENGMETVEDKDADKLTENRTVDRVNDQFAMESHQYGKDEENKIPGEKNPIMHISPKKNLAPVQHVSKGLVKNTPNEKNKDEVEMTSYALDDLTQSDNTDTEDYDLPPSNSVQGSPRLQRHQKVVLSCGLSVKHQNKSQLVQMPRVVKNSLQTTVRRSQEKFSKRRKTKSRSNHQKVKCDKEYYRGRLEGKKQNGGKTQSEIETNSSSVSSDILYEEHQPPELHLQREQEEWLLLEDQLIDKIDILSNKLSKAKNELYQRRDSLRMKTSILEKTQKELEMTKDKVKEFELSNHIQKEKLKKSSLKVESMQEKLTQKQREFALLQEISEDAQNKGAFKRRVLKSNWMNFRDRSLTVDASTEKQDHGVEERNKESTDEIIHLREQIRIYENEQAENEDMIRKLQQELADSQKEESMFSQKALEMKQLLKIYQMESELQESQEQKRETQQYNELEEHMQKFKMECATSENSGEQDENIWENINFYFSLEQNEKKII